MIIAEIGTSHGGSIQKGKDLIKAAAEAGCDAVKFQWVYADEILHPDTGFVTLPGGKIRLYDRFKELEVSSDFFSEMKDFAHQNNVQFICSPFGLRSLEELLAIEPDAVKIASPEVNHFPLLQKLHIYRRKQLNSGKKPVPVIISSGVSTLQDIAKALNCLGLTDHSVSLLHCITSYPAPENEYNVAVIKTLSAVLGIPTGISDHSMDPVLVPSLAVSQGSCITEKHITLSRETDGLDDPVALEPEQFALMVHAIHQSEVMMKHYGPVQGPVKIAEQLAQTYGKEKVSTVLGTGVKRLAESEKANYGRTNRSLHFMHAMKKGAVIQLEDISVLRTEKILTPGISPEFLEQITGSVLQRSVTAGSGVQWEDVLQK